MLLQHKYKEKAKLSTVIIFIPHCASKNQKESLRGEFLPQKWLEGEETCASYLGVSMTGFVWGMHIMNLEVVRDLREMEPGGSLAHSLCSCAKESCPLTLKLFVWGPSNPMAACMSSTAHPAERPCLYCWRHAPWEQEPRTKDRSLILKGMGMVWIKGLCTITKWKQSYVISDIGGI